MIHPIHATRQLVAAAAIAATLAGVSYASTAHPTRAHLSPGETIRITGCKAEDSCRIDYRPSGTWILHRGGQR